MPLEGVTTLFVVIPSIAPGLAIVRGAGNHLNKTFETLKALGNALPQIDQHAIGLTLQG